MNEEWKSGRRMKEGRMKRGEENEWMIKEWKGGRRTNECRTMRGRMNEWMDQLMAEERRGRRQVKSLIKNALTLYTNSWCSLSCMAVSSHASKCTNEKANMFFFGLSRAEKQKTSNNGSKNKETKANTMNKEWIWIKNKYGLRIHFKTLELRISKNKE